MRVPVPSRLAASTLVALALTLVVPAASAWASPADGSSPELGKAFADVTATLSFIDADGDGQPDASAPDEPVYLDLDGSQTVSYGDLRLTSFGPYPAGTLVDVANRDEARQLTTAGGWFGALGGAWYADLDGDSRLSEGDVRLDGAAAGTKADDATPGVGQALRLPPMAASPRGHLDHVDADRDGHLAVGSPLFVDADGDGQASAGDLRLANWGFGAESGPSPAELAAARDAALAAAAVAKASAEEPEPSWTVPQLLGVLIGLVAVAGVAHLYMRSRGPAAPRNPFK
jgi:hypothetical protein